jgi:hypothetical protein
MAGPEPHRKFGTFLAKSKQGKKLLPMKDDHDEQSHQR